MADRIEDMVGAPEGEPSSIEQMVGKPLTDVTSPSFGKRIRQGYRAVAEPVTRAVAQGFAGIPGGLGLTDLPERQEELGTGAVPRFLAGAVIPQTPEELALLPLAKPIGIVGKGVLQGARIAGPLVRGAIHAGLGAAAGGVTAALTGGEAAAGAAKGAVVGALGDVATGIKRALGRDVTPATQAGYGQLASRFGQPYTQAIVQDVPALQGIVRRYDDLQTLVAPAVDTRVGKAIYDPLRSAFQQNLSGVRFDFPYLGAGPYGRLTLPPTVSEVLPPKVQAILRRAGSLTAEEAMTIIQQLKAVGYGAPMDAIGHAARGFARNMEEDFLTAIAQQPNGGRLVQMYQEASKQYAAFKGLQSVITENVGKLFPSGGQTVGLNPAAWRTALQKNLDMAGETILPRLHNVVSGGGLSLGAGATEESAGPLLRLWERLGPVSLGEGTRGAAKHVQIPTEPQRPGLERLIPLALAGGTRELAQPSAARPGRTPWLSPLLDLSR